MNDDLFSKMARIAVFCMLKGVKPKACSKKRQRNKRKEENVEDREEGSSILSYSSLSDNFIFLSCDLISLISVLHFVL